MQSFNDLDRRIAELAVFLDPVPLRTIRISHLRNGAVQHGVRPRTGLDTRVTLSR